MFMEIAIAAIGIGIVLMVGYLVVAQVQYALPAVQTSYVNSCYGHGLSSTTYCNTSSIRCGPTTDNTSQYLTCANTDVSNGQASTMNTVFAGFGLVAVGIIVLAAFGLINIFK
jgi:hypothetical protein